MEKRKCQKCGTVIMIQNEQETLVKTRLVKIKNGKMEVKCPTCKSYVNIPI